MGIACRSGHCRAADSSLTDATASAGPGLASLPSLRQGLLDLCPRRRRGHRTSRELHRLVMSLAGAFPDSALFACEPGCAEWLDSTVYDTQSGAVGRRVPRRPRRMFRATPLGRRPGSGAPEEAIEQRRLRFATPKFFEVFLRLRQVSFRVEVRRLFEKESQRLAPLGRCLPVVEILAPL